MNESPFILYWMKKKFLHTESCLRKIYVNSQAHAITITFTQSDVFHLLATILKNGDKIDSSTSKFVNWSDVLKWEKTDNFERQSFQNNYFLEDISQIEALRENNRIFNKTNSSRKLNWIFFLEVPTFCNILEVYLRQTYWLTSCHFVLFYICNFVCAVNDNKDNCITIISINYKWVRLRMKKNIKNTKTYPESLMNGKR